MARNLAFVAAVGLFLTLLALIATYYFVVLRKRSAATWEGLLHRLAGVNRDNIALIASDLLDEAGGAENVGGADLEPDRIWELIGGMEGLERIEANCAVLVDLAFYVQNRYPEALLVAEELRLNTREIQWHVDRLRGAAQTGNLRSSFPAYAQRAIATYYLMTQRVLTLYEMLDLPERYELRTTL